MNTELFWDLTKAYHARQMCSGQDQLIELLIEQGISDSEEDRAAALAFLDQEGAASNHGGSPAVILAEALSVRERRIRQAYERESTRKAHEQFETVGEIAEAARRNPDASLEELKPLSEQLAEAARGIQQIYDLPKTPVGVDELIVFRDAHELPVDFLGGLRLPSPGITVIGGKAASGKTTALVNVARSLLAHGRSVAFFSYEQTAQDIGLILALSIMACEQCKPIKREQDYGPAERLTAPEDSQIKQLDEVLADYVTVLKRHIHDNGVPEFLHSAYERVKSYIREEKLQLWDYFGHVRELAAQIERSSFDVFVIDYVQVIPPAPGHAREGYQRIADVVGDFRRLSSAGAKTLVVGAQFNRQQGNSSDENEYDPSMEQFREAADIEHVATLAVGLGWYRATTGRRVHYWKILKHRYNGHAHEARMCSGGVFRYFYLHSYSRWFKPREWTPGASSLPAKASTKEKRGQLRSTDGDGEPNGNSWDIEKAREAQHKYGAV